ncbi:MAG TPA: hypothetical protein PLV41_09765, partial [Miltoncostaeales bacterium]|nr:hypothetical protein [Miltoncostaeales bacterium]
SSDWASHFLDTAGFSPRRVVSERVFDPDPAWLQVGRDGVHWTEALLPPLLAESNVEQLLEAKLSLLRDPMAAHAKGSARSAVV